MATLPPGLTQADIDNYARLDAGLKKLQDQHAVLNEKIKAAHKAAGYKGKKTLIYPSEKFGSVIVTLGEQKRVDSAALLKAHPEETYPEFYVSSLDTSKVPADILAKFKTNIVSTLSIKTGD